MRRKSTPEARPEVSMHLDARADDVGGPVVENVRFHARLITHARPKLLNVPRTTFSLKFSPDLRSGENFSQASVFPSSC